MIPKATTARAALARAVRFHAPPDVLADARALYTAARLQEQILEAFAKSPIDADDAQELAELILSGGEGR